MTDILAVTGSVTAATRLLRELERHGCINSRVVHTPTVLSNGGCSYSVRIGEECMQALNESAKIRRIKIKGIFKEYLEKGEYIYESIS